MGGMHICWGALFLFQNPYWFPQLFGSSCNTESCRKLVSMRRPAKICYVRYSCQHAEKLPGVHLTARRADEELQPSVTFPHPLCQESAGWARLSASGSCPSPQARVSSKPWGGESARNSAGGPIETSGFRQCSSPLAFPQVSDGWVSGSSFQELERRWTQQEELGCWGGCPGSDLQGVLAQEPGVQRKTSLWVFAVIENVQLNVVVENVPHHSVYLLQVWSSSGLNTGGSEAHSSVCVVLRWGLCSQDACASARHAVETVQLLIFFGRGNNRS